MSAAKDEISWEDPEFQMGIFTRFLIKGLEGAADGMAGTKDAKITAGELAAFLQKEVPTRSRELGKPAQNPITSGDFKSSYVISAVRDPSPPTSGPLPGPGLPQLDLRKLSSKDPALALMVLAGRMMMLSNALSDSNVPNAELVEFFNAARAKKIGTVPASISVGSLIGPVVSGDGSLLVACDETAQLVSISLRPDAKVRTVSLLDSRRHGQPTVVDSCAVSVSADNKYAATRLRTVGGASQLSLVALQANIPAPPLINEFESAAFTRGALVLSRPSGVRALATASWRVILDASLADLGLADGGPVRTVLADPESDNFAVLTDISDGSYSLADDRAFAGWGGHLLAQHRSCFAGAANGFHCADQRALEALGPPFQRSLSAGCKNGTARTFPSSSIIDSRGTLRAYVCPESRDELDFGLSDNSKEIRVTIPEPVLTARLLRSGRAIVLGRRGSIYAIDTVNFSDCCALRGATYGLRPLIGAGDGGHTAVLDPRGRLTLFLHNSLVNDLSLGDSTWVRQVALSNDGAVVALAGEAKTLLLDMTKGSLSSAQQIEVACGVPIAFDRRASTLACSVPSSSVVQVRRASDGKLERELVGHTGPLKQIYFDRATIFAAGTFTGRDQTLITSWNSSDGAVLSQRGCSVGDQTAQGPLAFLRGGAYFAQLDGTSVETNNSLTCESAKSLRSAAPHLTAASAADLVIDWSDQQTRLRLRSPWGGGDISLELGLPIQALEVSPDGSEAVAAIGGRIIRVPVTEAGFLRMVREQVPREFTPQECEDFFGRMPCPALKEK